jgi:hypothetical protein
LKTKYLIDILQPIIFQVVYDQCYFLLTYRTSQNGYKPRLRHAYHQVCFQPESFALYRDLAKLSVDFTCILQNRFPESNIDLGVFPVENVPCHVLLPHRFPIFRKKWHKLFSSMTK